MQGKDGRQVPCSAPGSWLRDCGQSASFPGQDSVDGIDITVSISQGCVLMKWVNTSALSQSSTPQ